MTAPHGPQSATPTRLAPAGDSEEATAAGIYGVIVSAAVMASSHAERAVGVVAAVLITLTIYWSAERFARVMAVRIHQGHQLTRRQVLRQLTSGWEIVTASTFPLVVLVILRLAGLSLDRALLGALVGSTALLCMAGWKIGEHGHLTTWERLAAAAVAGLFGGLLIGLKTLLH